MAIENCAEVQQTIQFHSCANILLLRLARRPNRSRYKGTRYNADRHICI